MHQRVVFQLELFWETERLNVMEFLLEDLRINQYGYPSPELDGRPRTVCFQIYEYSGLTLTEYHTATGGNKINKYDVLTSP